MNNYTATKILRAYNEILALNRTLEELNNEEDTELDTSILLTGDIKSLAPLLKSSKERGYLLYCNLLFAIDNASVTEEELANG